MGDEAVSARERRIWFWGILAVAVLLRVLAFNSFSAHHPDELIQYVEQAHRIVGVMEAPAVHVAKIHDAQHDRRQHLADQDGPPEITPRGRGRRRSRVGHAKTIRDRSR